MNKDRQHRLVAALLERHGRTYAAEAGIRVQDTPAPLFQLLVLSLLCSARIPAENALRGTRALFEAGLTTPKKMNDATWEERVRILNENGYARYDESTSRMLADTSSLILDRWKGDLRHLREEAGGDPGRISEGLQACKGLGPAGADIFRREVQGIWEELHPFFDARAKEGAEALGLPKTDATLAGLAGSRAETPRLAAALVRLKLAGDAEAVRQAA